MPRATAALLGAALVTGPGIDPGIGAQTPGAPAPPAAEQWDVTRARGKTRDIDFTTSAGTWMSVDESPDGRWIVFDLLGQIYRLPAAGGAAECLTENSGVALNFEPRLSPDGRTIAFVSDRRGQNNLWLMDADGANPRPVFTDLNVRVFEPAWTPDGQFIVVRRETTRGLSDDPGNEGSTGGLWMYSRAGGQGVPLVAGVGRLAPEWPSISADGRYLYYHASVPSVTDGEPLSGAQQLRRFEFRTGEIVDITAGESIGAAAGRISSGGGIAPEIAPDGRWLAFARQIPDGTISFKGHKYGPRTALWLRDLHTGSERLLMDPIEPQIASESKTLGVLPRYRWTADGRSIVVTQGGKIRRVDVATGRVATVPFTARVHRTISEMARKTFRIVDSAMPVRFMRWTTASADGRRVAFQAAGRVYVVDGPGAQPRRLTPAGFAPLEYAPAWSPDGRWLAFTTLDDSARGRVWKAPAAGGVPQRLTRETGDFADPVWAPDGRSLVVARGEGATARGRTMTHNVWFDLVRIPAAGETGRDTGEVVGTITRPTGSQLSGELRRQLPRASFGPEGRIFYPEEYGPTPGAAAPAGRPRSGVRLVSVDAHGRDKRVHMTFPWADEIVPSPDGARVAFQEGDNVYVTPMQWRGLGAEPVRVDKRHAAFAVVQLSREGGEFPRWRDGSTLEYASGTRYFAHHVDTGKTDTVPLALALPRALPNGSLAFTNARVVTLDHQLVIDTGTVVVRGSRIACVGAAAACPTAGVDRVIDARGKTIIPGFVDMHSHHYREWRGMRPAHDYEVAMYLAYGVTTDMDVSMWSQNVFPTAEAIEVGEAIGPRTFSTGDPLFAGDGPRQDELVSYAVTLQSVRRLAGWGATAMKQYLQPRRDQRQWVSEAARQVGVNVTAEGGDLLYDLSMIMDGQTGWEHPMGNVPLYGDAAKFFGLAHATYSPTLVVAGPGAWNIEYFFQASEVWKDPKQRRWFPWRMLIPHTRVRTLRPVTDYSYPLIAQAMADVIAEGGNGALGSHGEHHGLNVHWELWMGASALGNMGALEVASMGGARFLGAEQDIGSIEVGKLADLLVLNANPLDDIHHSLDMQYVMKGGTLYDAETLDQVWPRRVPFGPYYWVNPDALRSDDRPTDYWDRRTTP